MTCFFFHEHQLPLGSPAAAIVVFLYFSSFFSSWFPEWRSHCQWRCLSGESSAPCSGPVVLSRIGWVWGQHSAALPPGLTGVWYPSPEEPWCSWKGLGLWEGSWVLHSHPSLKRSLFLPAVTCPCLQEACALRECLGPKSRWQIPVPHRRPLPAAWVAPGGLSQDRAATALSLCCGLAAESCQHLP